MTLTNTTKSCLKPLNILHRTCGIPKLAKAKKKLHAWLIKKIRQETEKPEGSATTYRSYLQRVKDELHNLEEQAVKKSASINLAGSQYKDMKKPSEPIKSDNAALITYNKIAFLKKYQMMIQAGEPIHDLNLNKLPETAQESFLALSINMCKGPLGGAIKEASNRGFFCTDLGAVEEQCCWRYYINPTGSSDEIKIEEFLNQVKDCLKAPGFYNQKTLTRIVNGYITYNDERGITQGGWRNFEILAVLISMNNSYTKYQSKQYDPQAGKQMVPVHYKA